MVNALTGGAALTETELAVNISDLLVAPAWVIGGCLLWRREEFGYVTGLGLLFHASMLFIALIFFLLLQLFLADAPFAAADLGVILAMGFVFFIPLGLFVRGVVARNSSSIH